MEGEISEYWQAPVFEILKDSGLQNTINKIKQKIITKESLIEKMKNNAIGFGSYLFKKSDDFKNFLNENRF